MAISANLTLLRLVRELSIKKNKFMRIFVIILFLFTACYSFTQEIKSDNPQLVDAYKLAINTVDINTRRGILAAGGDYGGEWTRDIAISSWFSVSLLRPQVAEKSLWSVTINKDTIGHQYWDQIIWAVAALNHYKVTGNLTFLKQAYICSVNTIHKLEGTAFDTKFGLFTGPSVFNDGIAGYPEPVFDKTNTSSYVLDHPNSKHIKCLSTNSVYYGAYKSIIEMGQILKQNSSQIQEFETKAASLKANILKHLYSEKDNKLYYLVDNAENVDKSQEGLGISFAVIFGIVNKVQASKIINNVIVSKYGITSIYPDFPRFSKDKTGRHNNIIWPMVNGFFAQAAILAGNKSSFVKELDGLTQLALDENKGDYNFREIYNPYTGAPDGGWQCDTQWTSCRLQTWSATAYLNMVYYGLAGIRIETNGLIFAPFLPENVHLIELDNIIYRNSKIKLRIFGKGNKIKSFTLNGRKQTNYRINSNLTGINKITIEVE